MGQNPTHPNPAQQEAAMQVLYFAWLRQKIGVGEERLDPPADVATVGALVEWLKGRGPGYAAAFADTTRLRCAVNQDYAAFTSPVRAGDEVALFPPVTGG